MSKVYYTKVGKKEEFGSLADKTIALLKKIPTLASIKRNDLVGIKTHFGEKDNVGHVNSEIVRRVAEFLKEFSDRIFVTDTNTLYAGSRSNSVDHIKLAYEHNFALSKIGVPVIIADGLTGRDFASIKIPM